MSNEATVQCSLQINKGNLIYANRANNFRATVTGTKGPVPGAISVTTTGVSVDFSTQLTTPGLCVIRNLDSTNVVEYGIYDGTEFYPLGEILPGESYVIRFSRNLTKSLTGTATVDTTDRFRLRAQTATLNVSIEAFEA